MKSDGLHITVVDAKLQGSHVVPRAEVHPHDSSHDKNLNDIAHMNNMHEGTRTHQSSPRSGVMCVVIWLDQARCWTCCGVVT